MKAWQLFSGPQTLWEQGGGGRRGEGGGERRGRREGGRGGREEGWGKESVPKWADTHLPSGVKAGWGGVVWNEGRWEEREEK